MKTKLTVILLALLLLGGAACDSKDDFPQTREELEVYIAQKTIAAKMSLADHEARHPECVTLKEEWVKSEHNILCGNCGKSLFPKGIGARLYRNYQCPYCNSINGFDYESGVSRDPSYNRPRVKYYTATGWEKWNELCNQYYKCIEWWK